MHNHLRHIKGEPAAVSYCPLDMFSGTEARTARAIHGLWDAWKDSRGSVNNLRIFSQGQLLKPDDVSPGSASISPRSSQACYAN